MNCDCSSGTCPRCGKKCWSPDLYRNCQPPGLGDRVAAALQAVGITKERVSRLAGRDCGCGKRQEKLNELGRQMGIG